MFLNEVEPVKQEKEANFDVELLDEEQESDNEGNWDEDTIMSRDSDHEYKPEITQTQIDQEPNEEWSPNSRFKCKSCAKTFAKRSALTTHELSHLNLRNHTCPRKGCNSAFNVLYRLLRHMRNVHNADENEIDVVKETSREKLPVKTPEKDSKLKLKSEKTSVQCEVCLKVLSNVKYLKEHMSLQHLNDAPYVCEEKGCGKKFTDWSLLEKHQKKHEGKFEYNCTYCEKGFVQRKVLNQHLKKSHQISQEEIDEIQRTSGTCNICDCVFKSSQKLSEHRTFTHGIGDKFQCDSCGKIFFSKVVLTSHQKYHQQDFKKKKCFKCPSTFTEEKGLKTHMRRVHKMSEVAIFDIFLKQKKLKTSKF